MKEYARAIGFEYKTVPAFSHHCIGRAERFNASLVKCVSILIKEKKNSWPDYITPATFLYNCTKNVTTGHQPFYLLHGYEPNFSNEFEQFQHQDLDQSIADRLNKLEEVRKTIPKILEEASLRYKRYYDNKKSDITFKPGDLVLLKQEIDHSKKFSKFQNTWTGPHVVEKALSPVTYTILKTKYGKPTPYTCHVQNLKVYHKVCIL